MTSILDLAFAVPGKPTCWLCDCRERGLSGDEARLRNFLVNEIDVVALYLAVLDRLAVEGFSATHAAEIVETCLPALAAAIIDETEARLARC